MSDLKRLNLVLFFTQGVSLRTWDNLGSLPREVALYQELLPYLNSITFVTYGDWRDLSYKHQLKGIRLICNRFRLPKMLYILTLPYFYPWLLQGEVIFKSNQLRGAGIPLKLAHRLRKRFILRCGYLPSEFAAWSYGAKSFRTRRIKRMEASLFRSASKVIVTTPAMQQAILEGYGIETAKVQIIPNYVDTDVFKPSSTFRKSNHLCFVGRLHEQKNLNSLLDALQGLDLELDIIGNGNLRKKLMKEAKEKGLRVNFLGNLPNPDLPTYLNRASLFILPSHIEGHPKALLEAMACGLPVIGTNVPGIRDVIRHRETGFLCNTNPEDIRQAIKEVLGDPGLCIRMGSNARNFILENFALKRVKEMELKVLQELSMQM